MDFHGLHGNRFSDAWSTSFPSCTELGVCRVDSMTYSHSSGSVAVLWLAFLPFLAVLSQRFYDTSLRGSALTRGQSVLEPTGIGSARHGEASGSFLQKPSLWPPPYQNLAMQTKCSSMTGRVVRQVSNSQLFFCSLAKLNHLMYVLCRAAMMTLQQSQSCCISSYSYHQVFPNN